MDGEFICADCSCVLRPGEGNLHLVKIIAINDPTPEQLAEPITLEDIQAEIAEIHRRLANQSPADAMREVYSSRILHFCNTCFKRWDEDPVH